MIVATSALSISATAYYFLKIKTPTQPQDETSTDQEQPAEEEESPTYSVVEVGFGESAESQNGVTLTLIGNVFDLESAKWNPNAPDRKLDINLELENKKDSPVYYSVHGFRLKDTNNVVYEPQWGGAWAKQFPALQEDGSLLPDESVEGGMSFFIPKTLTDYNFKLIYENVVVSFLVVK